MSARAGRPQRSPGSQASSQFAAQCASPLNVKALIDGFVTDPHLLVVGEVEWQPTGNLFGTPGARPSATLPWSRPSPFPFHTRPRYFQAIVGADFSSEPILSTAATKCAKRRRKSVPVGLIEKGRKALVFGVAARIEARGAERSARRRFRVWGQRLLRWSFSRWRSARGQTDAAPSCWRRAGSFRRSFPGCGHDG
jgi:hypothetical protein